MILVELSHFSRPPKISHPADGEDVLEGKPYRNRLLNLLKTHFDVNDSIARFEKSTRGKPYLANSDIRFNISHSDNYLAIAISRDYEIGVDIEQFQPRMRDYLAIAERYFSTQEFSDLQALTPSDRPSAFYSMWTQKEAVVKASGDGLSQNFERVDTSQFENCRVPETMTGHGMFIHHWELRMNENSGSLSAESLINVDITRAPEAYLSLAAITPTTPDIRIIWSD